MAVNQEFCSLLPFPLSSIARLLLANELVYELQIIYDDKDIARKQEIERENRQGRNEARKGLIEWLKWLLSELFTEARPKRVPNWQSLHTFTTAGKLNGKRIIKPFFCIHLWLWWRWQSGSS